MEYVYKEPETWDDLFDALDALAMDPTGSPYGYRVCQSVREFFRTPGAPKTLTEAWSFLGASVGHSEMSVAQHVRCWLDDNLGLPEDLDDSMSEYIWTGEVDDDGDEELCAGPVPAIEPFREYLREKLREAARRFPPKA